MARDAVVELTSHDAGNARTAHAASFGDWTIAMPARANRN
jgi:hypothetical protein